MFENIMSAERHSVLEELAKKILLLNYYLAGGPALALYLGHRWSEDLDFFTEQEFDSFQLADAEKEAMPKMFRDVPWEQIKKHFLLRQKELAKELIEGKEL